MIKNRIRELSREKIVAKVVKKDGTVLNLSAEAYETYKKDQGDMKSVSLQELREMLDE